MADRERYPHYIEFRHLSKGFDQPVLVDCSFWLDPGETLGIIGRSGVGKSVALSHMMGFLKPDEGRVIVAHEDITDYSESELNRIRRKVTMVFQSGALFDSLTVGENVAFPLESREYTPQNIDEVVGGLLKMVELEEYKDVLPAQLPTGLKRAVAIARALAAEPEAILYDEPTTMVDPPMAEHVGDLIRRLKGQLRLTSVVVTHDLTLLYKVADKVVFLEEGRVIFFGELEEMARAGHATIQEFLTLDRLQTVG
ncbi:MAG: ATP-binding cassette domain-containing protein [Acidobacteria bacterium]|nr:ATP-binding cassette domain-containing protein [Acidobacteriota bacterium]